MPVESEELLKQQALVNRYQYQNKILEQSEKDGEQQTVTIASSYESSSGLMQLSDSASSTFYGRAITNGAIGLNESIRLRGGTIPSYDALPYKAPEKPAMFVQPPVIFIGFLARIKANFGFGDRLKQVKYVLDEYETYWALGYFQNSSITIKQILRLDYSYPIIQIPTLTIWDDSYITSTAFIPAYNYYSIGFVSATWRCFLYGSNHLRYEGENKDIAKLDPLGMDIDMYDLNTQVIKSLNNSSFQNLKQKVISLTTANIVINGVNYNSTSNYFPYSTGLFGEVIKYRTPEGIIKYLALCGNTRESSPLSTPLEGYNSEGLNPSGVVIWELGDIDNIPLAVTNPACYFGHSWKYENPYVDGTFVFDPVLCYGGYGADGGIVLNIETISQQLLHKDGTAEYTTPVKGWVFIPEHFLAGTAGTEISKSTILSMMTNNPPPPLDTRLADYPGKLNIDPALNLPSADYKLFFYVSTRDQNRQIFT